jgi:hypothetical protein
MSQDPVLPTYDISVKGPCVSLQSSSKAFESSEHGKNVSVVTRKRWGSVEEGSGDMASQTTLDELPELVFLTDNKQ